MNVAYPLYDRPPTFVSGVITWATKYVVDTLAPPGIYASVDTSDIFSEFELYSFAGWDGYDAEPILPETIRASRALYRLLPMDAPRPDIALGADGTIGFEWRSGSATNRNFVIIEVGPRGHVIASRIAPDGSLHRYAPTGIHTGARALVEQLFS